MKRTTSNDHGFAAVETILIIIILAIIGFTGYYVWHSKQNADKTLNTASHTAQNNKITQATRYLTIKEWGVEIPLSAGIQDAYYAHPASYSSDGTPNGLLANTVDLGTRSLTALNSQCSPTQTPPGALVRQTADEHTANVAYNKEGKVQADLEMYPVYTYRVGNYYYDFIHAQASCGTINSQAGKIQAADANLFHLAVERIRAVQ